MDTSQFIIPLILIVGGIIAGCTIQFLISRANDNKRRIDELERAQREKQLPYKVAENIEDATAIVWQQRRELELDILHGEQRVKEARLKLSEWDRAIDKLKNARANGQKSQIKGNGK